MIRALLALLFVQPVATGWRRKDYGAGEEIDIEIDIGDAATHYHIAAAVLVNFGRQGVGQHDLDRFLRRNALLARK